MSIFIKSSKNSTQMIQKFFYFHQILKPFLILVQGNNITILNAEGKEVQLNASALQVAASQSAIGMLCFLFSIEKQTFQ